MMGYLKSYSKKEDFLGGFCKGIIFFVPVWLIFLGGLAQGASPVLEIEKGGKAQFVIDAGPGREDTSVLRIGRRIETAEFYTHRHFKLASYVEAAGSLWKGDDDLLIVASFSPVLYLSFFREWDFHPYIFAGVGLSLSSENEIEGRDLGSHFLFENRIGIGIKAKEWDIHATYFHYSNGGLTTPNSGMDAYLLGVSFQF